MRKDKQITKGNKMMKKVLFDNYDSETKLMVETELDITNEPTIDEFLTKGNLNDYIIKVGNIIPADGIVSKKLKCGYRVNVKDEWKKHEHWVYVLVMDGKVLKCGDSTMTLKGRWGSYSAGTRKSRDRGTCSTTNYFISEIIRASHRLGYKFELYGYAIPPIYADVNIFGEVETCRGDFVSRFESKLMKKFVDNFDHLPIVGTNGLVY
jgi:hypothetical protein